MKPMKTYYCRKCKKRHNKSSSIGRSHTPKRRKKNPKESEYHHKYGRAGFRYEKSPKGGEIYSDDWKFITAASLGKYDDPDHGVQISLLLRDEEMVIHLQGPSDKDWWFDRDDYLVYQSLTKKRAGQIMRRM